MGLQPLQSPQADERPGQAHSQARLAWRGLGAAAGEATQLTSTPPQGEQQQRGQKEPENLV